VYAVTITQPGGPEVLGWTEVPDPVPDRHQVLIDVAASAVNRADLLQRAGFYAPPPGASPLPGLECSGRVAAVGGDVTRWGVGDEVCALLAGGGYAQRVAVDADHCLPVPRGVALVDAATLPEAACTVWSNLVDEGRLQSLDALLIHGGGSGIGTFAIQFASARGARVLTTARAGKHAALHELGAEVVIDYDREDFVAAVRTATHAHGADVILDIMGAAYLTRNVEALATGGRLVVIGLQGGRRAELDLSQLMAKQASITGTLLRPRTAPEKAAIVAAVAEHVWPLIGTGVIRPIVYERVPMPEAARAHRIVEESEHIGKVALVAPSS
jgi:putative PIG3 family NAD(P)H quinone oxidoreductase